MINSSTLDKLNKLDVGLDIDKLELFIEYFRQARLIADMSNYEYRYLNICKYLSELKPNSKVLKDDKIYAEISLDKFDKIFKKYRNDKCVTAYGKEDFGKINLVQENYFDEDNCKDLLAINNVDGLDIMCTYINGRIYRIYGIGENNKYFDFTDKLKDRVPNFVEDLALYNLVELRGKATIPKNKYKKFSSNSCSTIYYLNNNINIDNIQLIFHNILFEEDIELFDNNWDKLEWLRELKFSVPHHALIRNVDKIQFEAALEEFDNYIRDIDEKTPIMYDTIGFIVKDNKDTNNKNLICYDTNNVDYNKKFESVVKDIKIDIDESYLRIVSKKCNNGIIIDSIEIDDIYCLEKNRIDIGSKVNFIVVEGKAIIVDK